MKGGDSPFQHFEIPEQRAFEYEWEMHDRGWARANARAAVRLRAGSSDGWRKSVRLRESSHASGLSSLARKLAAALEDQVLAPGKA
ncbi:Protein of unknown function [Gryllus bimaculatus]|nr:Protein of unknown function [Gryllus bimaculatus]